MRGEEEGGRDWKSTKKDKRGGWRKTNVGREERRLEDRELRRGGEMGGEDQRDGQRREENRGDEKRRYPPLIIYSDFNCRISQRLTRKTGKVPLNDLSIVLSPVTKLGYFSFTCILLLHLGQLHIPVLS